MAGSEVFEWPDLDSEIKTAGLKNVSGGICFVTLLSWSVPHRTLLPLQTCTPYVYHTRDTANRDHRLVSGNMRHNWRTGKSIHKRTASNSEKSTCLAAYSYFDETKPIAFLSEQPRCMFLKKIPGLHILTLSFSTQIVFRTRTKHTIVLNICGCSR